MKVSDLKEEEIHVGLKIRSMVDPNRIGTIVERQDRGGDIWWWVQFEGDDKPYTAIFFNHCECEVVEK